MSDKPETKPEIDSDQEAHALEIELFKQSAKEAKKKADEYYDQLLRLQAEFANFRKRVEKEKAESRAWGKQEVLLQLISLVDVFDQAMAQIHQAKDMKQIVQGVEMLHKSFSQFIKAEGIEPIDVVGKPFDPEVAEAMEQEEVDEDEVGKVLSEVQKGYRFQGRVLRPSRVRVGVAKKAEEDKKSEEKGD